MRARREAGHGSHHIDRIPGKDAIIHSQNQFIVNTAFRYLQDSAGVFLLDFSRLQMCFLTHI